MFDTSLVRARAVDPHRRFTLLTASIAIHSAAVIAVISAGIASVDFPVVAPDQMEVFMPVATPQPPPLPLGRRDATPRPPDPAPVKTPSVREVVPPVEIPTETILPSSSPSTVDVGTSTPVTGPGTGEGPIGDPDGKPWGIDIGQKAGGTGTLPIPDGPLTPGGEVKAPRVLRRVEPRYPQILISSRQRAVVTVRCVIDRTGTIRDPQVIRSSFPPFNDEVLNAVRQWTFVPGTMRGEPVDTWFELTVTFEVR